MKKIIISNYDDRKNPYYGGGGAIAVHEVAKRMADEYSVTVLTGRYPGSEDEVIDRVRYVRTGFSWTGPRASQLVFQCTLPIHVMLRSFDCWIESFTPPFSTAFLQLFTARPVVGLTHLLAAKNMSDKYGIPFDKIESLGLRSYRYFITLTEQARRKVLAQNIDASVVVIPNGVDVVPASVPGSDRTHILYIGRIDVEQKGLDLLLEAISTARSEIHDKVYIAGSGPDVSVDYLVDRIASLGLNGMVEYVGRVTGQDKEDLFRNAKFLVMPSRYETLPLTLLEGFAHSCPVVMFDIDDLRWVPESCAVRVEPFSGGDFGRAVAELSRDHGKLDVMQGHAELFSRGFSWDAIAQRYIKFLRQVGV